MGWRIEEGQRFGRLVAIRQIGRTDGGHAVWQCRCDCGQETWVASTGLKQGMTRSCGCLRKTAAQVREEIRKAAAMDRLPANLVRVDATALVDAFEEARAQGKVKSWNQLSRATGLARSTLETARTAGKVSTREAAETIAKALGVKPKQIIREEDQKK